MSQRTGPGPERDGGGTVLVVTDTSATGTAVESALAATDAITTVEIADPCLAGDRLATDDVDCIVSDLDLADESELDRRSALRANASDLPIVVVDEGTEDTTRDEDVDVTDRLSWSPEEGDGAELAECVTQAIVRNRAVRSQEAGGTHDEVRSELRVITDCTADAIVRLEPDGTIRYANGTTRAMFGLDPDELIGESLGVLLPQRLRDDHLAVIERYLDAGTSIVEFPALHSDGHEFPASVSFGELTDDPGFVAVIRDQSRREAIATELSEQETRYRHALDSIEDCVWISDLEKTEMRFVNRAYETIFGRSVESLLSAPRSFVDAVHPDDRERVREAVERQRTAPDEYEETYRVVRPDGSVRWVRDRSSGIEDGGELIGVVGIATDITRQRERERELQRRRELLTYTERLAGTGGWEIDLETGEQRWTDGTYAIHDLDPNGDFDPTVDAGIEFYHPDDRDRIAGLVERCRTHGEPYEVELRLITADDRVRWMRTHGEPVTTDGTITAIRGAIQDVTERKQREEQLAGMDRMLRHNLRNEMNIVIGNAERIGQSGEGEIAAAAASIEAAATGLLTAADKQREIIDILATRPDPVPTDISGLATRCVQRVTNRYPDADVSITVEGDGEALAIPAFESAIAEVVRNAIEHANTSTPTVRVAVTSTDDDCTLTVRDSGAAMPPADVAVLRKDISDETDSVLHGSGMGLWLVRVIVSASDGTVTYEPADPAGNVVKLTLPR